MSNITACPLDCYDQCSVIVDNETDKLSGDKEDLYTNGYLCQHLNHYRSQERIEVPTYKGKTITMQEAEEILFQLLSKNEPKDTLFYRGSGNIGLMQDVTEHFFSEYGGFSTNGSLCDGAGQAAIRDSRGFNQVTTPEEIEQSEVIIFWGRNPHTSQSHILPFIKDKKIIVIDPMKTKIAFQADFHLQLKPKGDLYLALLLARFVIIEGLEDQDFLDEYCEDFEDFYELTQGVRIKTILEQIDVSLGDIGKIIEIIRDKKVTIMIGAGVQKYHDGADIIRAIDSFGAVLGLHNKEGCGVNFLGDSRLGIESPFAKSRKLVSKVNTKFSDFKTVFIQGANPLSQMPDRLRVINELGKVENIIYFGLYKNESSDIADLIIPAKSFLEKNDIRVSYSSNRMQKMCKLLDAKFGIGEYELSRYLCDKFNIDLESEEFYINHFLSFSKKNEDGTLDVKGRKRLPYSEGFKSDEGKFIFLQELDFNADFEKDLFLITAKSKSGLNSQFRRDNFVYIHPSLGFKESELVTIVSPNGSIKLKVKNSNNMRNDSLLIYSGCEECNILTSSKVSVEGNSAIFQENKVQIIKG